MSSQINEKYHAEVLGFCFDTGHANLVGIDFESFLTTFGDKKFLDMAAGGNAAEATEKNRDTISEEGEGFEYFSNEFT